MTRVVQARVLGCVGVQRRGRERVEDRHRLASPADAPAYRPGDAVRRAHLAGLVTAGSVGQVLAVVRGIGGVDLLAVVGTARRGVTETGRRRGDGRRRGGPAVQRLRQRLVQAVHRGDRREDRRRQAQVGVDRAPVLSLDRVDVQVHRECVLDLRRGSAGLDVGVVRSRRADREPRRAEPVPHRLDRRVGRGVPRAHLRRAQVVTVGAAVRIGHGRGDGFGPGLVAHLEVDAEPDTAVGRGCRDLVAWRRPPRVRVWQRSRAGRAGRSGHGDTEADGGGGATQQHKHSTHGKPPLQMLRRPRSVPPAIDPAVMATAAAVALYRRNRDDPIPAPLTHG